MRSPENLQPEKKGIIQSKTEHYNPLKVQVALIKMWAKAEGLDPESDKVCNLWIKSGLSRRFRQYIEAHQDNPIDICNEEEPCSVS